MGQYDLPCNNIFGPSAWDSLLSDLHNVTDTGTLSDN